MSDSDQPGVPADKSDAAPTVTATDSGSGSPGTVVATAAGGNGGQWKFWLCFVTALLVAAGFAWMVNDLRVTSKATMAHAKETMETAKETLDKVKISAEVGAEISKDLKALRKLAGVGGTGANNGFSDYANEVLDLIDAVGAGNAKIGILKKGDTKLKDPVPMEEWSASAHREAVLLVLTSKSKAAILKGICRNKWGAEFGIQVGNEPPVTLEKWVKDRHAPSKDLKLD